MTDFRKLIDKRWLAIGKALPFSIYDAQRKLLLSQGHVIESERSLDRLLDQGQYYKLEAHGDEESSVAEELADGNPVDPLTALSRDYANISQRARYGVKIAPKETGESYLCLVVGFSHENRCLIMTAPARPDGSLAPISRGQVWFCRMFSSTSVFRFRGAILKVALEPYPYLHILVPEGIEQQLMRQLPRAQVSLPATLQTSEPHPVTIVDLSVGGAQIGANKTLALEMGDTVQLTVTIDVLGRWQELCLQAKVAVIYGVADSRHPGVIFYGLSFESLEERVALMLHGYVQQQLASEYDCLGQVLALGVVSP